MFKRLKRWRRKAAVLKRLYDEIAGAYDDLKAARGKLVSAESLMGVNRDLTSEEYTQIFAAVVAGRKVTDALFAALDEAKRRL